jgi:hypothetical protein
MVAPQPPKRKENARRGTLWFGLDWNSGDLSTGKTTLLQRLDKRLTMSVAVAETYSVIGTASGNRASLF